MGTRKEIEQLMQETSEKLYNFGYSEMKKLYKEGLKDAWECARKIACMDWENDTKLFGCENPFEIYSVFEAMTKIKEYEESQKCKGCVHYSENGISCNATCTWCVNNDLFVGKNELHKEYEVEERFDEETRSVKYMFKEKEPEDTLEKQEEKSCKNCNTACVLVNTSAIPCSNWTSKHSKEGNHV